MIYIVHFLFYLKKVTLFNLNFIKIAKEYFLAGMTFFTMIAQTITLKSSSEDELRKYGKSKQHQPLPIVGMGMFMDHDGIPLAFDIFPGNKNEQPTLKPLEQKVIDDYGVDSIIICTDAGLFFKCQ